MSSNRRSPVEAVLFDNDGVLVDTESLYMEAARITFAEIGVDLTLETYQEVSLRQGNSVIDLALDHGYTAEQVVELRGKRDRRYAEFLEQGVTVIPGARETVQRLRDEGKRLAIVTTCPGRHFEIQHRNTGLLDLFEFVLVREDYPRSKPYPDPYATAVKRMGIDADRCVAIEDTQRGVDAANAAGVKCYACRSEMTRGTQFTDAIEVLGSVAELPDAISRID